MSRKVIRWCPVPSADKSCQFLGVLTPILTPDRLRREERNTTCDPKKVNKACVPSTVPSDTCQHCP